MDERAVQLVWKTRLDHPAQRHLSLRRNSGRETGPKRYILRDIVKQRQTVTPASTARRRLKEIPKDENNDIDFSKDFFGKETNLTVSGQLEAEALALGMGKVYTFGPTFRAENSNTSRHLAEFWMIEPEMAFYELSDNIDLAESFIKYIIKDVYEKCKKEINFLSERLLKEEQSLPKVERNE